MKPYFVENSASFFHIFFAGTPRRLAKDAMPLLARSRLIDFFSLIFSCRLASYLIKMSDYMIDNFFWHLAWRHYKKRVINIGRRFGWLEWYSSPITTLLTCILYRWNISPYFAMRAARDIRDDLATAWHARVPAAAVLLYGCYFWEKKKVFLFLFTDTVKKYARWR